MLPAALTCQYSRIFIDAYSVDHGTPFPLREALTGHNITRTQDRGWDMLSNGALLTAAEQAGFELLLTTDKNIRYQQNLTGRTIAILVLGTSQWPVLRLHVQRLPPRSTP